MTPFIIIMSVGLLLSQFISTATREQRLAKGQVWYPPTPIILVCVWGLVGNVVSLALMYRTTAQNPGTYGVIIPVIFSTVCLIGYWRMRKWGVIAYTIIFVISQLLSIALFDWPSIITLIGPLLFIYIGYANFRDMT